MTRTWFLLVSITHTPTAVIILSLQSGRAKEGGWAETTIFDFLFIVVLQREMVQCNPDWLKYVEELSLYKTAHLV